MARLNEILAGRFNRALQKTFGIKGGPPVATLAPELMPIVPVFSGVENRYLESWNEFGGSGGPGALAANNSAVRVRNPANSAIVAVFESIFFTESIADTVGLVINTIVNIGTPDLTTALGSFAQRLDARASLNIVRSALVFSQQNGASQAGLAYLTVPVAATTLSPNLIFYENQELPLLPGDGIQFTTGAVNTALSVYLRWRERPLEDSEKI